MPLLCIFRRPTSIPQLYEVDIPAAEAAEGGVPVQTKVKVACFCALCIFLFHADAVGWRCSDDTIPSIMMQLETYRTNNMYRRPTVSLQPSPGLTLPLRLDTLSFYAVPHCLLFSVY